MSRKRYKAVKFVSFVELTNDVDELLELFSQAESLNVQAEHELKLRRLERELIKRKLKMVRGNQKITHVSDHAIVRYLDRVIGIDIEACKRDMLAKLPKDFTPDEKVEFVKIPVDGLQYVMRDNLIISVTPTAPHRGEATPKKEENVWTRPFNLDPNHFLLLLGDEPWP